MAIQPIEQGWAKPLGQVLSQLEVAESGISDAEAEKRLKLFGKNTLSTEKKKSALKRLAQQFLSPVVLTLIAATLISLLLGEYIDAVAILTIVVLNSFIGYIQEAKAEAAIEALKKLSAPRTRVLRGKIIEIASTDVCIGDILILEAGDYVPADARIMIANQLTTNEAVLTGESLPVKKSENPAGPNAILADRKNILFAGTTLATGSARAVVIATGMSTEIGRIASMLKSAEVSKTPLQERLEQVSNKLLYLCGFVVVVVGAIEFVRGEKLLDVFMTSVSLAVAAIPEGLPAVVTVALALAIKRMVKRNALVRHLPAVETLGSTDVICTDKTGTLTTGKMKVREFVLANGNVLKIDAPGDSNNFFDLFKCSVLCSNASFSDGVGTGDPTEIALLEAAFGLGVTNPKATRMNEWSFDSDRKRMSVAVRENQQDFLYVKGAPEAIIPLCLGVDPATQLALSTLANSGRRVLALAKREMSVNEIKSDCQSVERNLKFLGLISMADPPRPESLVSIQKCKAAGIKVVMITGDHPVTAKAIAGELSITDLGKFDGVLTGVEIDAMTDADLEKHITKTAVYARVSPEHKIRIVRAWQKNGHVVAMTGDGVNDAPALKQANIGVAMGKGGTEVARQASSMILTDDNFSTIVSAIEEGRAIFGNIRRTIQYLLSGNLSEILIMMGAAIAGWPAPLAPIHLLWINLVTDGIPALALAAEPVPEKHLETSNRPSPQSFFDRWFYSEMAIVGIMTTILALAIYGYSLKNEGEDTARTHVFSFLVFAELFRSFACRSEHKTFFQLGLTSNIYHLVAVAIPIGFQIGLHHTTTFQHIFKVHSISWTECLMLAGATLLPVSVLEIRKIIKQGSKK